MKLPAALLAVLLPLPAIAQSGEFTYKARCYAEVFSRYIGDVCTIVETREPSGALRSRNIYSDRFGLTVKSRFDPVKGFLTWDSISKMEYKWHYQVGQADGSVASYVMPGFLVENLSWD